MVELGQELVAIQARTLINQQTMPCATSLLILFLFRLFPFGFLELISILIVGLRTPTLFYVYCGLHGTISAELLDKDLDRLNRML